MTAKRFIVDDAGTLIDVQTRDMFDIVEEVCPLLNELHEENMELKELSEENKQLKRRLMIMEDKVKGLMK